METVRISLHNRVEPSFTVDVALARVPVHGEILDYDNKSYFVETVIFYLNTMDPPYVVAKTRLK